MSYDYDMLLAEIREAVKKSEIKLKENVPMMLRLLHEEYIKEGLEPDKAKKRARDKVLADLIDLGFNKVSIINVMPLEYKDEVKVKAGKESAKKREEEKAIQLEAIKSVGTIDTKDDDKDDKSEPYISVHSNEQDNKENAYTLAKINSKYVKSCPHCNKEIIIMILQDGVDVLI